MSAASNNSAEHFDIKKRDVRISMIRAVKNHPVLWDKKNVGYRDKLTRDKAWKTIQKELMPDYYDISQPERVAARRLIMKQWNNIRDSYRKVKSKRKNGDRMYRYSDELEFLDDFFSHDSGKDHKAEVEFDESGDSNSDQEASNETLCKHSNELSTVNIIRAVNTQPLLWDPKVPGGRHKKARKNAWEEVCKIVVPNYSEMDATQRHTTALMVTKKWQASRDSYLKSYKARLQSKDNYRPYIYDAEINFLDTVFKDTVTDQGKDRSKRNRSDDRGNDSYQEISSSDEEMPNYEENEIYFDLDATQNHNQSSSWAIENITSTGGNVNMSQDENVISILSNLIQREEDEDNAFFKSITPAVKSLTDEAKFEFRIEVMHLIKRLRGDDKKNLTKIEFCGEHE